MPDKIAANCFFGALDEMVTSWVLSEHEFPLVECGGCHRRHSAEWNAVVNQRAPDRGHRAESSENLMTPETLNDVFFTLSNGAAIALP